MSGTTSNFTLQLIHASDLEAANTALSRMPQFAAIEDKLSGQYANTLKIISGDAWLNGPFYAAEGDPSELTALRTALAAAGVAGAATATVASTRVDVAFMDLIGTNVASFGNHEFDSGTGPINDALGVANFPYLSENYDFSQDPNLRSRVTANGQEASTIKGRIAGSAVVTIGGQKIGVVGDTTQILASISSPGGVVGKTPNVDDMAALAKVLQPAIDALLAQGINKIVLSSHLQQYQLEQALIPLLRGVDIVISAGSHALFADGTDTIRAGDTAAQGYPVLLKGADGNPVLQVNSENEYSYVNRLVVQFDASGVVVPSSVDPAVSGAYATTDAGVAALYGNADPYAAGSVGGNVKALIAPITAVITTKDSNIQGYSNVFLAGDRNTVRQQESNLGDLSADANLYLARQVDPTAIVSIKNGGGIRDIIGSYSTGADSKPIATVANPISGKPAGAVSQLDIENSLRFNNNLSLVTINAQQLKQVMEFGATLVQAGQTPGGFVQVGGLNVSYDLTRTAQVLDTRGNPTTVGSRVRNLAITNADGSIRDVIVADGQVVGNAGRAIRLVTLDFIATGTSGTGTLGGDGNPLGAYATNRVDLLNNAALGAGLSTFATPGSEQDALGEYLKATYGTAATAYNTAETPTSGDLRIENLAVRSDAVLATGAAGAVAAAYGGRAASFIGAVLGSNGFVLQAPGTDTLGSLPGGRPALAQLRPTAANSVNLLPNGFRAAALTGPNAGALFGQGSDYLLVGGSAGGTLVAQGTGTATVVGGSAGTAMFGAAGRTVMVGGDGADTLVGGSGDAMMFSGGGANLLGLGAGTTMALAEGRDTVIAGSGAATVGATGGALVFGGRGPLSFVNGGAASTVVGGSGSASISGGAGGGLFAGGTDGNNLLLAGTGAATLIGGGNGDQLFAGSGGNTVLVAAATGNATLSGANTAGPATFFAGGGNVLMASGTGNDVFFAGSGAATVLGGAGADRVAFVNGQAGGTVVVADFNAAEGDRVTLQGYGAGAASAALAGARSSSGGTTISLTDGTRVTFLGVGSLNSGAFV